MEVKSSVTHVDGCVSVELKIINADWPSPLSAWGNQDINANIELEFFIKIRNDVFHPKS